MAGLVTVKTGSACVLVTRRSGEFASSPKWLPVAAPPTGSTMPLIADGSVVTGVAVPPSVPAVVTPLTVPGGCVGSVTV